MSATTPRSGGEIGATLLLSWLTALGLLAALVWAADVWNVLAISRLLDPLIEGGVIQYHDSQLGYVPGLPDPELYLKSQDPIDWRLVLVSALLLVAIAALRGIQFRDVLVHCGIPCSSRVAGRAILHGTAMNRWLPFNAGDIATVLSLKAHGVAPAQATVALHLMRVLLVIELAVFALIGLVVLGWMPWLVQIFWALVILAVSWWFLRPATGTARGWAGAANFAEGVRTLAREPPTLARLVVLALLTFLLEHISAYVLAMAFTSTNVLMNIPFSLFVMALVAGFVARLIPLTPGGLGQFEWGFASALYVGGIGIPEAATAALLFAVLRYVVGTALDLMTRLSQGAPEARSVLAILAGRATVEGSPT